MARGLARWADQGAIDPAHARTVERAAERAVVLGVAMLQSGDPGSSTAAAVVDLLVSLLGGRVAATAT